MSVVPDVAVSSVDSAAGDADVEMAALEELWRLKKLRMRGRRRLAPGSKPMSRSSMALSALPLESSDMSE